MAAGERSGGSDLRLAQRRSPPVLLLLPLLLLPARPALGNEGAAAGNCRCAKYRTEPELVRRFPERLVGWERCRRLVRFLFPKNPVCGWHDAPWVLRLTAGMEDKPKGRGSAQVSPTSHAPLQPLSSSVGSTPGVSRETLPSQQLPRETPSQQLLPLTHTTAAPAPESVPRAVLPRNGAVAEASPTRSGQEEERVPDWNVQAAVFSALGIVLLLVTLGLLCWWRPPRRGGQAALTSKEQEWMLQRLGAAPTYSPRAEAAAGSDWGA